MYCYSESIKSKEPYIINFAICLIEEEPKEKGQFLIYSSHRAMIDCLGIGYLGKGHSVKLSLMGQRSIENAGALLSSE